MDLRHLATLDAVATEGTFGKAADRLGYTQSAVSQQVAALEKAVGGAVFDRPGGPKPVRLTPLGEVVLAHGRELLARAAATEDAVERFKAGEGRVDIGTFQSVTNVILPTVVRQLLTEHPAADIRLFEEETDQPSADGLDLVFFDGRVKDADQVKILDDPYVLVTRRGQFPPGPVPLQALHGAAMVAQPPICDQARVERVYADAGVAPLIVFRTADNRGVISMVRAGMGVAVMPRLALDVPSDDLSTHELEPALAPREIYLAWQANRTLSPLATRVIELTRQTTAKL
ncbi:LysR family transcriptional regulator [Lentzea sp. BCCO 10_0061]|uniref:LysR family transcriptional regulator n=1 Tax=Lentzea sokolovensis TaxID=3095429 RepID=A0ABU4UUD4_9PSEU|nr:LysR family transcriptional regulator [Lentzea sp. BCCO 10_0061]MDX8142353.1 LysR family transcriptional regulator [Lentzea sp. BCCO 10_0061]